MADPHTIEHPALLVMDMMNGTVQRYGNDTALLERTSTAIHAARAANIPVIYVVIRLREGFPEMNPRNRQFALVQQTGSMFIEGSLTTEIHPAIAPQKSDVVVTKRRVGAFSGSDLDVVLRAKEIDSLVLCGIATSGVVLSTLRLAADLDFNLTVLSDCCTDNDAEVHRVLMEKVFPRQATVMTAADWIAAIEKS